VPDTASPAFAALVGTGIGLLFFGRATGRALAHVVTLVHELGHAGVGILVGGRVRRVSIALDASGETLTLVGGRLPRLRLTLFTLAGYPAPGLVALLAAWAVSSGDHRTFLLVSAAFSALALVLWVRNLWGITVFAVTVAVLWLAATEGDEVITRTATIALAWLLGLGGLRSAWHLARGRSRAAGGLNDAQRVSQLTRVVPTGLVAAGFVVLSAACLGLSAALLLRPT